MLLATGHTMTFSFLPSSPCQPDEVHFSLALLMDGEDNEVSWALIETYTGSIALSGSGYSNNEQTNIDACMSTMCYTFVINCTGTEDLCCAFCSGSIRLNGLKVAVGNPFGSADEYNLPCIRPPTFFPISAAPVSASARVGGCKP